MGVCISKICGDGLYFFCFSAVPPSVPLPYCLFYARAVIMWSFYSAWWRCISHAGVNAGWLRAYTPGVHILRSPRLPPCCRLAAKNAASSRRIRLCLAYRLNRAISCLRSALWTALRTLSTTFLSKAALGGMVWHGTARVPASLCVKHACRTARGGFCSNTCAAAGGHWASLFRSRPHRLWRAIFSPAGFTLIPPRRPYRMAPYIASGTAYDAAGWRDAATVAAVSFGRRSPGKYRFSSTFLPLFNFLPQALRSFWRGICNIKRLRSYLGVGL